MIAFERKPIYRNDSPIGNGNGSFSAFRANEHGSFLLSLTFSTLVYIASGRIFL